MQTEIGLRELAKIANVDVSTISRALNRNPRISKERAQAIRELAARNGYRPKPMRSNRKNAIGVLIGSNDTERIGGAGEFFLERLAWLAQRVLSCKNFHVNVECFLRDSDGARLPAVLLENRVDGVLIAGHPSQAFVARIRELGIPAVAVNDSFSRIGIPCVCSYPRQAIEQAVLRLAAWGHRRFAFLMNDTQFPTSETKLSAFRQALAQVDIPFAPEYLVDHLPSEIPGGREGIRRLCDSVPDAMPTAIFCTNDWVALGAIMELMDAGKRIPRDVSIVGHDDVAFARMLNPALTTISRSEETLVSDAVNLLLDIIGGAPVPGKDLFIGGEVIWRGSTGPAPGHGASLSGETAGKPQEAAIDGHP